MRLAILVLLAIVPFVAKAEEFRFNESGTRDPKGKTLADWGQLAISARSEEFRLKAARVLTASVSQVSAFGELVKLSPEEKKDARHGAMLMLQGKDVEVRRIGAEVLKSVGDDSCVDLLLRMLKSTDAIDRASALDTLSAFPNNQCIEAFSSIAAGSKSDAARFAIGLFPKIGTKEARAELERLKIKIKDDTRLKYIDAALDEMDFK